MQIELTSTVNLVSVGQEFFPVKMQGPMPSMSGDEAWQAFVVPNGKSMLVSTEDAERCRFYMGRHHTDAISEDGITAFTLRGNRLVECNPDFQQVAA